ncbi:diguanylate cyclase regulator RdcB family protein [Neisseria bacilliformis]|uniref:diguanylate cyclase regulator RdcB family protein n=1 Tax=Neisseria bacilliformis TaxID=267212 RepID=UPI0028EBEDF2|nr:diguanylate cyclase regulator RdcB family protein [Neisseria bacilliformis]
MENPIVLSQTTKDIFPYVTDKLVVDFVNGIDVAKELNAAAKKRQGLFARMLDGVSGKSAMRQQHTNDHLLNGLEACRGLFNELSGDVEKHSAAIIQINKALQTANETTVSLINATVEFKQEFKAFAADTQRQFAGLQNDLDATKRLFRADQQLNRLMDKWAAGGFATLSPIARAYAVVDALKWGAFGERMRLDGDNREFMENLRDKLVRQLREDLKLENTEIGVLKEDWTRQPENVPADLLEALQFQGDWCLNAPDVFSTTLLATQPLLPEYRREVPNIPTVQTVAKHLVSDTFAENEYAR